MKLKELEKRLDKEPDNLGLRVQVAGLMREAGRSVEAVELYRSVALAYRDQGRTQQAIAVCRSILDIAPEDGACQGLLAALQAPPSRPSAQSRPSIPARRSSLDETPLPKPVPHHVMDPTSQKYRLSDRDLQLPLPPADVTPTPPSNAIPTSQIDAAAEVETRQRPKIRTDQLAKLDDVVTRPGGDDDDGPDGRPTPVTDKSMRLTPFPRDSPVVRLSPPIPIPRDSDDMLTQPRSALPPSDEPEEQTVPRERQNLFDDDE